MRRLSPPGLLNTGHPRLCRYRSKAPGAFNAPRMAAQKEDVVGCSAGTDGGKIACASMTGLSDCGAVSGGALAEGIKSYYCNFGIGQRWSAMDQVA